MYRSTASALKALDSISIITSAALGSNGRIMTLSY
jgi:hypothetical protein